MIQNISSPLNMIAFGTEDEVRQGRKRNRVINDNFYVSNQIRFVSFE